LISGAGGDLNAATDAGDTPLHSAVMGGYLEAVEFLLANGSNPNQPNAKGETPLMHSITASVDGFAKMKLLVTKRAEVNAKSSEGLTALMLAAQAMQRGALMYLLGQGADPNATDGSGATALRLLAQNVRDGRVHSRDYPAMIQALAKASSSVEQRDAAGMTPLMWATISDLPEAVTPLLAKGADIHARSLDGRTVLMWAASANAGKTVLLLIERGAEVGAKDAQGRTAFEWAKILGLPVAQAMEAQSRAR
jgi:serine/threonine-protein phosphatase 6 regulatory ankyrin repeat subunit B